MSERLPEHLSDETVEEQRQTVAQIKAQLRRESKILEWLRQGRFLLYGPCAALPSSPKEESE